MTTLCSFILPLRSKSVTSDWKLISYLCCQTVNSCLNSEVLQIQVLVVGHEIPEGFEKFRDHRVRFIQATHKAPVSSAGSMGMNDKWAKVAHGFVDLYEDPPEYLMIVDADDLVSSRLVTYLKETRPENGLVIKHGYIYDFQKKRFRLVMNSFNCGTNSVIRTDVIHLPSSLSEKERLKCLPLAAGHTIIEQRMLDEGKPLAVVPYPAAAYLQYADQHSREGLSEGVPSPRSLLRNALTSILLPVIGTMSRQPKRTVLENEFGLLREEQGS